MASRFSETIPKFTAETLKLAAKQSEGCRVVPPRLRRAIKRYLKEKDIMHMRRNVLSLAQSFKGIKEMNLLLPSTTSRELVEDPFKSMEPSQRWKVKSSYGDVGFKYQEEQTAAYVAVRMPAVYSALYRVLSEVRRRVPGLNPSRVLDFGSGTGSAFWAMMEVWPGSVKEINLVEPSQTMQRAGQNLIKDLKNLPLIQSYDSILELSKHVNKSGGNRRHDLVIASYVLGEIPSLKDRITVARQLWELTGDVLVLVEPGTPQGSNIISQMRSHILWMEKRKTRKLMNAAKKSKNDLMTLKTGAFVVAPCPHDGPCPLQNTDKYCHFVQRLERTSTQRAYKSSRVPLRGYEDEKFSYVALRRGTCPSDPWPLNGMKFETLQEKKANRIPEDLEIEVESQFSNEVDGDHLEDVDGDHLEDVDDDASLQISDRKKAKRYDSDMSETESDDTEEELEDSGEETPRADLGSGWGRIIYMPFRRGNRVEMDLCRSTNVEGTEGSFDRVVVTQRLNPALHHQARRSLWGDLWPLRSERSSKYYM